MLALIYIIIADLVPLRERGTYTAVLAAVIAFASAIGPPIGGVIAQVNWRWIFCALHLSLSLFLTLCADEVS